MRLRLTVPLTLLGLVCGLAISITPASGAGGSPPVSAVVTQPLPVCTDMAAFDGPWTCTRPPAFAPTRYEDCSRVECVYYAEIFYGIDDVQLGAVYTSCKVRLVGRRVDVSNFTLRRTEGSDIYGKLLASLEIVTSVGIFTVDSIGWCANGGKLLEGETLSCNGRMRANDNAGYYVSFDYKWRNRYEKHPQTADGYWHVREWTAKMICGNRTVVCQFET